MPNTALDWEKLLNDHEIPYVTKGPNTKRGEISVPCPYCGDNDPSEHMGIGASGWGCLRDASHRGTNPVRLISALLGCSVSAGRLLVEQYSSVDPDALGELGGAQRPYLDGGMGATGNLVLSPSSLNGFEEIKDHGTTKRFWSYLANRGFADVGMLSSVYNLRCANTGRYKDRIIIPFYDESGQLLGWTGRAITNPKLAPRYLTNLVGRTVFNRQMTTSGGELILITEGPFDAMKLDYYGVPAVATLGVTLSTEQIALLNSIKRRYKRAILLWDSDAVSQVYALADWLHPIEIGLLPEGVKDPGDLTHEQIRYLLATTA